MEINGIIELILDEHQINDRFKKREFVINAQGENSSYENFIKLELVQDNCSIIDTFKIGDKVSVQFNISGRKWVNPKGEEVYFNSLKAWKILPVIDPKTNAKNDYNNEHTSLVEPEWLKSDNDANTVGGAGEEDDLPF